MDSIIYVSPDNKFKVIDLNKEYNGNNKETPYAIVTDLLEVCLHRAYGSVVKQYSPFVLLTDEMFEAMHDSYKNDHREHMRESLFHDTLSLDAAVFLVDEYSNPVRISESLYTMDCLFKRMSKLANGAGPRIYKKYVIGFTSREIATQEGTTFDEVRKCIYRALPELHKIFVDLGVAA